MSEEIKNLIEKIQQDGIRVAEEKAREIEAQAQEKAEEILRKARLESEKIISQAKDSVAKMEEKQKTLLTQAARDMLLVLRKEINAMLEKLIHTQIKSALTPEVLAEILGSLIKEVGSHKKSDIVVLLKKPDLELLEKGLFAKLGEAAKEGIVLKASEDIQAGFIISYDAGKSQFDFSDKALAEYIGNHLKPKLAEILESAIK